MTRQTIGRKPLAVLGSVAVAVVLLGACGGQIRAERKGKKAGEAICDVKTAGSADEAQRQLSQAQRKLSDVQRIVGRPINEDLRDINQNMTDLIEHVRQGNKALAQIIDRALFDAVQEMLDRNRERAGRRRKHPELSLMAGGRARKGELVCQPEPNTMPGRASACRISGWTAGWSGTPCV